MQSHDISFIQPKKDMGFAMADWTQLDPNFEDIAIDDGHMWNPIAIATQKFEIQRLGVDSCLVANYPRIVSGL